MSPFPVLASEIGWVSPFLTANVKQVDADKHVKAHDKTGISRKETGIGGGRYSLRFQEEIEKLGGYDKVKPKQLNEIRDRLMKEFDL